MKQTYLMPLTQKEVLVESNAMQILSQSQDNPPLPGTSDTPVQFAPKVV